MLTDVQYVLPNIIGEFIQLHRRIARWNSGCMNLPSLK